MNLAGRSAVISLLVLTLFKGGAGAAEDIAPACNDPHPVTQGVVTSLRTAPETPSHPLDPLTPAEHQKIKQILARQGGFGENAVFAFVQLKEPPKQEVLAFTGGQAFRREAFVNLLSPERKTAFEVIVDLRGERILSQKDLGALQPMASWWDYVTTMEVLNKSSEIQEALRKRGYSLAGKSIEDVVYVEPDAPGRSWRAEKQPHKYPNDPLAQKGKTSRLVRAFFADRQGPKETTLNYGPALEGLMALVDVYNKKIAYLYDVPGPAIRTRIPHNVFDPAILGSLAQKSSLHTTPKTIENLTLQGNHVRWGDWDFRYGFNMREGLTLHQIAFEDNGKRRSICYRAAISELLVPYAGVTEDWVWREFYDAGDYGLGAFSTSARPGKELPANAMTIDVVLPNYNLTLPEPMPQRVFLFERDGGLLAYHVQDAARTYVRGKELVVGFITTLGNYDYTCQWIFRQDGSFGFETELNGVIEHMTVDEDQQCEQCLRERSQGPGTYVGKGDQKFGTLVAPQTVGVHHQHWFNLRLDFDTDGPSNAVKEVNVRSLPFDAEANPAGRAFTVETTIFGKEKEATRHLNPASNRSWAIFNPDSQSPLGHFAGYQIHPMSNTATSLPRKRYGDATSFTQYHFWATAYHPDELYATGAYPSQAPRDYTDHLARYVANNEAIYKQDVVVWYSLGITHIVAPEDFPLMPCVKAGVNFVPAGFFAKSPALKHTKTEVPTVPAQPRTSKK